LLLLLLLSPVSGRRGPRSHARQAERVAGPAGRHHQSKASISISRGSRTCKCVRASPRRPPARPTSWRRLAALRRRRRRRWSLGRVSLAALGGLACATRSHGASRLIELNGGESARGASESGAQNWVQQPPAAPTPFAPSAPGRWPADRFVQPGRVGLASGRVKAALCCIVALMLAVH
jgi:hypothetical protein